MKCQITLDSWEIKIGTWIGQKRYELARQAGVKSYQKNIGKSWTEMDVMGTLGELAFAKLCNLYFPLTEPITQKSQPDFILPNGWKVDVKTTEYMTGKLLMSVKEIKNPVDIYVLMIDKRPTFHYAGYLMADQLIQPSNIMHFSPYANGKLRTPAYAVAQDHLRKMLPMEILESAL